MLAGKAYGAKDRTSFVQQERHSTTLAGIAARLLASSLYITGDPLILLIMKDLQDQLVASAHLGHAAVYIALSFAAFQLDGIIIGVIKSVEMRNATLMALFLFIGSGLWLQ